MGLLVREQGHGPAACDRALEPASSQAAVAALCSNLALMARRTRAVVYAVFDAGFWLVLVAVAAIALLGLAAALPVTLLPAQARHTSFAVNAFIDFRSAGDAAPYLRGGWGPPTKDGRPTEGVLADIVLPTNGLRGWMVLELAATPLFTDSCSRYDVTALVNGMAVSTWAMDRATGQRIDTALTLEPPIVEAAQPFHVSFAVRAPCKGTDDGGPGLLVEALRLRDP